MTTRITVVPESADASVYGPVEIAWYADHLEITALGAGRASVAERQPGTAGDDVVLEIRPSEVDEPVETMPGAD